MEVNKSNLPKKIKPKTNAVKYGHELMMRRVDLQITLNELSKVVSYSESLLANWESGKALPPKNVREMIERRIRHYEARREPQYWRK